MKSYEEMLSEYKAAKQAVKNSLVDAKEILTAHVRSIISEYPDILGVSWTQYTPSFNDGDPCVFSTNADFPDFKIKDEPGEYKYKYSFSDDISEKMNPIFDDIGKQLGKVPDDIYLEAFGDYAKVTVELDSLSIEDYYD